MNNSHIRVMFSSWTYCQICIEINFKICSSLAIFLHVCFMCKWIFWVAQRWCRSSTVRYPGLFRSNCILIFQSFWLFVIKCMCKLHSGKGSDVFIAHERLIYISMFDCATIYSKYINFPNWWPHICVYIVYIFHPHERLQYFPQIKYICISFLHAANVERVFCFVSFSN